MSRRAYRFACLTLLATGGCSLFVTLDELAGGGGRSDAGAAESAAAASDAGALGRDDAQGTKSDAGADVIAPPAPFCSAFDAGTFCSDFDNAFPAPWDTLQQVNGATLARGDAAALSAPFSLVADTRTGTHAALYKDFSGARSTALVNFDMRIESRTAAAGRFAVFTIRFDPDSPRLLVQTTATSTVITQETDLADGGLDSVSTTGGGVVPIDTWVHVTFAVDLSKRTASLSIDGTKRAALGPSETKQLGANFVAGVPRMRLGAYYTSDAEARFDNFTLTFP